LHSIEGKEYSEEGRAKKTNGIKDEEKNRRKTKGRGEKKD